MNRRDDLLELTPQALTALANAGFVKRAQREVGAGQLPQLSQDEQHAVIAVFDDGVSTRFPLGVGLSDATCSCPASGMCRHRVTLVLAWQAQQQAAGCDVDEVTAQAAGVAGAGGNSADSGVGDVPDRAAGAVVAPAVGAAATAPAAPAAAMVPARVAAAAQGGTPAGRLGAAAGSEAFSPAEFDDAQLTQALGATVLAQATRFAAQQPTVRVQPWQGSETPPLARLPMCTVRFFSRHNLLLARCDCVAGGRCAHVALAVWAFRQAQPVAGGDERVLTLRGPVPWGTTGAQGAEASPADEALSGAASHAEGITVPDAPVTGRAARTRTPGKEPEADYAVFDTGGDAFGLRSEQGLRARAALDALLRQLWLDGAVQPQLALVSRFAAVQADVQALGWQWVSDALTELEQQLHALLTRSTRFDMQRLLDVSTELWARCRSAEHQWQKEQQAQQRGQAGSLAAHEAMSASEVLGRGVRGEVALDHLRLVSLGGQLWSDTHQEGVSVFLADPDTQSLLVLERTWDKAVAAAPTAGSGPLPVAAVTAASAAAGAPGLLQRRMVNVPVRQLLESQVVTKAAKRRANGLVDIGGTKRQTGMLPLSPTAWQDLSPPLCQPSLTSLAQQLNRQVPAFVAPRHAIGGAMAGVSGHLHVVRLQAAALTHWWWDAASQTVHAVWQEADAEPGADLIDEADPAQARGAQPSLGGGVGGQSLRVQLRYSSEAPGAVDALAKACAGQWGAVLMVAGPAWRAQGQLWLQPTALVCEQRAVVLAAQAPDPQPMPPSVPESDASWRTQVIQQVQSHLALLLRDGMRHQGGTWSQTLAGLAEGLQQAGLAQAAQLLLQLRGALQGGAPEGWLSAVNRLSLLLGELQMGEA